jgi:hypothetical protein
MSDPELLAALSDLREVEAEIARLQAERAALRERLSLIVATRYDNKATVPGFGVLAIRAPSVSQRWDTGALADLVQSLREQGQADLADEIEGCKKRVESEGGLAITPERKRDA